MARRPASDLLREASFYGGGSKPPELPVKTALDRLTETEGPMLELMTRADPGVIKAAQALLIYTEMYKSGYAKARLMQLYRLKVAAGGGGRRDMIDAVEAGGRVPDAVFGGAASEYFRED